MSAGAINMPKTAICSLTCEHAEKMIYEGLGLVDISVEPHFNTRGASDELCDDGVIIYENEATTFLGDVFLINKDVVKQVSFS